MKYIIGIGKKVEPIECPIGKVGLKEDPFKCDFCMHTAFEAAHQHNHSRKKKAVPNPFADINNILVFQGNKTFEETQEQEG